VSAASRAFPPTRLDRPPLHHKAHRPAHSAQGKTHQWHERARVLLQCVRELGVERKQVLQHHRQLLRRRVRVQSVPIHCLAIHAPWTRLSAEAAQEFRKETTRGAAADAACEVVPAVRGSLGEDGALVAVEHAPLCTRGRQSQRWRDVSVERPGHRRQGERVQRRSAALHEALCATEAHRPSPTLLSSWNASGRCSCWPSATARGETRRKKRTGKCALPGEVVPADSC